MKTIKAEVIQNLEQCIAEAKAEGKGYLIRMEIPYFGYNDSGHSTYLNYPAKIVSRYCYAHDFYWGNATSAGVCEEGIHGNTGVIVFDWSLIQ